MQENEVFRIDDPYSFLTKGLLETEYLTNKLSDRQIAQKYNIGSKVTVWRRRQFFGVSNKLPTKSNTNASKNRRFDITLEHAQQLKSDGKSIKDIALVMGCSRMVACRRLKELGLVRDTPSTQKKLRWHEPINDLQHKFLLGDILGDGNITAGGMYQCNHSRKQLDYITYKHQVLINFLAPDFELIHQDVKNHQNGKTYKTVFLRTMQNEHLQKIHHVFYRGKIKTFPVDHLDKSTFDAYSLAIWYMDDGSRNGNTCHLHTYDFEYGGNVEIIGFLWKKFGLIGSIEKDNSKHRTPGKEYHIRFNVDEAAKFFAFVAPHILPYFYYKLPQGFRPVTAE